MNQPLRLFYAIEVPAEIRNELEKFGVALDRQWRPVKPEQMHITLAFMGEVPEDRLERVIKAGEAAAASVSRFAVELSDTSCFPESGGPKVLYARVDGGNTLAQLADHLRNELVDLVDGKKFKPHLTLARSRGDLARRVLRKFKGNWPVETISLFRSTPGESGTRHECIQKFNLKSS